MQPNDPVTFSGSVSRK